MHAREDGKSNVNIVGIQEKPVESQVKQADNVEAVNDGNVNKVKHPSQSMFGAKTVVEAEIDDSHVKFRQKCLRKRN